MRLKYSLSYSMIYDDACDDVGHGVIIYIRKIKIMMTKMKMMKMMIAMKIMIMMMTKNLYIGNMKNSRCSFLPPKARYVGGS